MLNVQIIKQENWQRTFAESLSLTGIQLEGRSRQEKENTLETSTALSVLRPDSHDAFKTIFRISDEQRRVVALTLFPDCRVMLIWS